MGFVNIVRLVEVFFKKILINLISSDQNTTTAMQWMQVGQVVSSMTEPSIGLINLCLENNWFVS